MKPVILLLSTYPFLQPKHGGQVRLANIAKVFSSAGWQVESIAVYEPEGYASDLIGKNDITFPPSSQHRNFKGRSVPFINDLLSGIYAAADDGGFSSIVTRLPKKIDVIHVEQPWLWPLAAAIKKLPAYERAILIYGSQNIEAPLKREILASYGIGGVDDIIEHIEELEKKAARDADLILAVTPADLDNLARHTQKKLLLAPNGIEPWFASDEILDAWRSRLPEGPWILYVASAHPPNFKGFTACIGDSLACIPPDSKLVVAGSVSEHLYRCLAETPWCALNLSRLQLLYVLSDLDLAAVKSLAHAFLLPILHGGGSNIKTAEALYSGAYVVGSEAAFRGFEDFAFLPEVTVAKNPQEFQCGIRDILSRPKKFNSLGTGVRGALQWDHCLNPIVSAVSRLIGWEP